MTSILGIRTNSGQDGIVIAADSQLTLSKEDEIVEKRRIYKIWHGKNWAMAHSGGYNDEIYRFQGVMEGKRRYDSSEELVDQMIKRALTPNKEGERRFIEVDALNSEIRTRRGIDDCVEFIFATIEPEIGLWQVHEWGVLMDYKKVNSSNDENKEREFEYLVLGSGSDNIVHYIEDQLSDPGDPLDPNNITLPVAIRLAREAIRKARRDPYTGGPSDVVMLTKSERVDPYGKEIRTEVDNAEKKVWDKIERIYEPRVQKD